MAAAQADADLSVGQRWASGVLACALAAVFVVLVTMTVATVSPAAECAGAPSGCVVHTTERPDGSVALLTCAAAVYFSLIALTGQVWVFKAAGAELAPAVRPSSSDEIAGQTASGGVEDVPVPAEAVDDPAQDPSVVSARLWASLDKDIASELDAQWREWFNVTVVDRVVAVKRATGKGNHAWFVRARNDEDQPIWVRVTKGGRAGGSRATRRDP